MGCSSSMNASISPTLTVSFVLYNTPLDEVRRSINQVTQSISDAQIILIDNSPRPNPLPKLSSLVEVIRPGRNLGYGAGHNLALKRNLKSVYHAVLNTDLVYDSHTLPKLLEFMDDNESVGLSMPLIRYPDGALQTVCRLLPDPIDVFARGFFPNTKWAAERNRRYEFRDWHYGSIADFPFLSGCFMLLRRSVMAEVGGFDERFFMYGEDADLSRRIHAVARTTFVPHVTAVHDYRSQSLGYRRVFTKTINLARYFNKWGWFFDQERQRMNLAAIRGLSAAAQRERQ